jgi:hypothetical protein
MIGRGASPEPLADAADHDRRDQERPGVDDKEQCRRGPERERSSSKEGPEQVRTRARRRDKCIRATDETIPNIAAEIQSAEPVAP